MNGTMRGLRDPGAPLYLAILGEVYDVSVGRKYYGPGEGYHCFVGRCQSPLNDDPFYSPPIYDPRAQRAE